MHITEGLFEKWDNKISARLLDEVFSNTTDDYLIEWIFTVYVQGIMGVWVKPDSSSMNTVSTVP